MKLRLLCSLGVSLVVCACSPAPTSDEGGIENPEDFDLRTNQTTYLAKPSEALYSFSLTAELENTMGETLYLDLCLPDDTTPIYSVTTADEEGGESAWNPNWGCAGHDERIALEPGQTRSDTYEIVGPTSSSSGQPVGRMEGLFRLSYKTLTCTDGGTCDTISSNAFRVELAD